MSCRTPPVSADAFRATKLFLTTVEVSGEPSWKTTPGRRVMVQTSKAAFGVSDRARYGWMVPSLATAISGS